MQTDFQTNYSPLVVRMVSATVGLRYHPTMPLPLEAELLAAAGAADAPLQVLLALTRGLGGVLR